MFYSLKEAGAVRANELDASLGARRRPARLRRAELDGFSALRYFRLFLFSCTVAATLQHHIRVSAIIRDKVANCDT